ncbi:MAG: hypothetical protein AB9836_07095 [Aminipila sp.]
MMTVNLNEYFKKQNKFSGNVLFQKIMKLYLMNHMDIQIRKKE